jgi:hypothetical protein
VVTGGRQNSAPENRWNDDECCSTGIGGALAATNTSLCLQDGRLASIGVARRHRLRENSVLYDCVPALPSSQKTRQARHTSKQS